jgi:CHAD domain-containing protein
MSAYVEALKRVQDVIGEHQDAVVAAERIRSVASGGHAVAERLIEAEPLRAARPPRQYRRARRRSPSRAQGAFD